MKKFIGYTILISILVTVTGYLAGVFVQFYYTTRSWSGADNELLTESVKFDVASVIGYLFTRSGLTTWLILVFLAIIGAYFIKLQFGAEALDERGVKYSDKGTFGTAKWMDDVTAKKVFEISPLKKCESILFGSYNGLALAQSRDSFGNKHILVFGASGSGKSYSFVRPNIFQVAKMGQSMIITDPKGELYRDMAVFLKKMGYTVKVFNLVHPIHSDRWNPLSEVYGDDADLKAHVFADIVIANTKLDTKKSGDPFWDRAELNLLKALSLYIAMDYPVQSRNLGELFNLLSCSDSHKVDTIFEKLPDNHPAKAPYNIYKQANENVRTGVVIGLGTRLQVFQNQTIKRMTATNDIDLVAPGKEKCAYFCILSDTSSTLDYLASLFFSFLFIRLMEYADTRGGKGEREVYFMLDEFSNIGQIPDFLKKIATMRSRGLHCHIIIQSISQLKEKYMLEGSQIILSNCDTKLCLGVNDNQTAEFVQETIGVATIKTESHKKKLGWEGVFDYGSESREDDKRYLLNADEVMKLPKDKAIVMLRGNNPLMIKKLGWNKHYMHKKIIVQNATDYNPPWAAELQPIETTIPEPIVTENETPKKRSKPLPKQVHHQEESERRKEINEVKEPIEQPQNTYVPKPFKNFQDVSANEAPKENKPKKKSEKSKIRDSFFNN